MRYVDAARTAVEIQSGDVKTIIPAVRGNADYEALLAAGAAIEEWVGPPLEQLIEAAKTAVDADAERQRLRWLTPGSGQQQEYSQVALEAGAVLSGDDPKPTIAQYRMLAASIGTEVPRTGDEAADLIAAATFIQGRRSQVYAVGVAIREERLRLKGELSRATSAQHIAAIQATAHWPG